MSPDHQGRGVAAQVALARRESPHRGQQHVGLALHTPRRDALHPAAPCWLDGSPSGRRRCWRARPPACPGLTGPEIDRRLAGDHDAIEAMGDGELVGRVRRLAYELDPVVVRGAPAPRRGRPTGDGATDAGRDGPGVRSAPGQGRGRGLGRALAGGRPSQDAWATSARATRSWPTPWSRRVLNPGEAADPPVHVDDQRRGLRLRAAR